MNGYPYDEWVRIMNSYPDEEWARIMNSYERPNPPGWDQCPTCGRAARARTRRRVVIRQSGANLDQG